MHSHRYWYTFMKDMTSPILFGRSMKIQNSKETAGVNDINISSNLMLHYIFKALVMCLCFIGCMWQIASILRLYFDYPTTVFVSVKTMDKLELPGITLCNNNRLMMSKLRAHDQEFSDKWAVLTNSSNTTDMDNNLQKQSLIDESLRNMMDKLPVSEFMNFGHSANDFLVSQFFKCASDRLHPSEPCIKFANVITTAQDLGNCFTLFHKRRSELLQTLSIDSGLSQSPVKRGKGDAVNIEISEEPFHPNEVLRLKLNFHAEEYTTLNEPVVGHIIVHDDDEAPVVREKSFLIEPGFYYEFFINKATDFLLPKPYVTDCIDHKKLESDGSIDINEYLHHPLSRKNCIIGCMAQNTMNKCECWPPELPFMKGTADDSQENSMKWCDWDSNWKNLEKPPNSTWFQFCFTAHEQECNTKCKYDCSIDRYRITKEVRQWPATQRIEHSLKGDYLFEMRKCCAIVSIRYWNSENNINQYQPKFETAEFTSYIGGLLSMWIGFSLLGVYDVFEVITIYLYKHWKEQREKSNLDTIPENIPTIQVYNTRMNYDQQYRSAMRRKTWQRKAKVAAIIERMSRSPSNPLTITHNKQ